MVFAVSPFALIVGAAIGLGILFVIVVIVFLLTKENKKYSH